MASKPVQQRLDSLSQVKADAEALTRNRLAESGLYETRAETPAVAEEAPELPAAPEIQVEEAQEEPTPKANSKK